MAGTDGNLKEMLIDAKEWFSMVSDASKAVNLEEFAKGQSYNLPNFGDSVELINSKLKQLNENLQKQELYLEFESYRNLYESIVELVGNSPVYKVIQSFTDLEGNEHTKITNKAYSPVTSFNIQVMRK